MRYDNAMFAVGTGAGVTIWFATLVTLVEKNKVRFDPKTLHRVTRFFGLVMPMVSIVPGWNLFSDLLLKQ